METSRLVSISSTVLTVLALALTLSPRMPMTNAFVLPPQSTASTAAAIHTRSIHTITTSSSRHSNNSNKNNLVVFSIEDRIRFSDSNEASRKFRRTVYSFADWPVHRSPERFRDGVKTFFASRILRGLFQQVAFIGWVATFVVCWNGLTGGFVDFGGVQRAPLLKGLPMMVLPMELFSLTSSSLGLLLVFRTNASYGRWDEARKMWGLMINRSRNIVRKGVTWYDVSPGTGKEEEPDTASAFLKEEDMNGEEEAILFGEESKNNSNNKKSDNNNLGITRSGVNVGTRIVGDVERVRKLRRLSNAVWSFSRSLQRHLTPPEEDEEAFRKDIRARLDRRQADALIAADHRPNKAMFDIGCAINDLPMHFMKRNNMDEDVATFEDIAGGCERIFSSPIPLVYSRHSARFLGLYCLFLPLGLWKPFKYSWNSIAMIPAVMMISLFLMGISELAISLEEPFSILPLDVISKKIGVNCDEIVTWDPRSS